MTRTHITALAFVLAAGAAPAAQAPAPAPLPPAAAPRPLPDPSEALQRAREALERANIDRGDIAGELERARDAMTALRAVDVPQLPDLHLELPDFDIQIPDVEWAFDFDAGWMRDVEFEVEAFARQARDMALAFGQAPGSVPVAPPARPAPAPPYAFATPRSADGLYEQARGFIDRDQYDRALQPLDRLIAQKGARADAAMYWKAYSLSKLGRSPEALAALADMRKQFPNSSWIRDAGFLEIEIKQASGQAVNADAQVSEDIRLLALQGIMRSDPATAIPVVEKTLAGNSSIRVKERALFVLSQSGDARARDVITGVAKGSSNPDLKIAAIRYLGRTSGADVPQTLEEIYRGTSDGDVKRAALQALSTARAADRLGSIARAEKDASLRQAAIRYLGRSNAPDAAETLRVLYGTDTSADSRRAVIDALSSHRGGAPALVALARAEKDPQMQREMVRRLANMRAPEAQQYMLELLNK